MNTQTPIYPVEIDVNFNNPYGWLLPNGDYYSTDEIEQHEVLLETIIEHILGEKFIRKHNCVVYAENMNWIRLGNSDFNYMWFQCENIKNMTQKQIDGVFLYATKYKHMVDYKKILSVHMEH